MGLRLRVSVCFGFEDDVFVVELGLLLRNIGIMISLDGECSFFIEIFEKERNMLYSEFSFELDV